MVKDEREVGAVGMGNACECMSKRMGMPSALMRGGATFATDAPQVRILLLGQRIRRNG